MKQATFLITLAALAAGAQVGFAQAPQGYNITDLGALLGSNCIASCASGVNQQGWVTGYWVSTNGIRGFVYTGTAVQDLGSLGTGTNQYALSINSAGQVAGFCNGTKGAISAFLYSNGSLTNFGPDLGLGGLNSYAYALNDAAQMTGYLDTTNGPVGFFYGDGGAVSLGGLPGATNSQAYGLNNLGVVVGSAPAVDGSTNAFLWTLNGGMANLNDLTGDTNWQLTQARSVDDLGDVVGNGFYAVNAAQEGFVFTPAYGEIMEIGLPAGATNSYALAINNAFQAVGGATLSNGITKAFLWDWGALVCLNNVLPSGSAWDLREAWSINVAGQIAGWGVTNGQVHAFLLSPNSAPSITSQPQDQSVLLGSNATFTVSATGIAPLGCQWQFNGGNLSDGGNISGSGTMTLTITGVGSGNVGTYSAVVTNVAGSAVSAGAALTLAGPPVITQQPIDALVDMGQTAQISVVAIGAGNLACQWYANGVPMQDGGRISGSATATLTISNVSETDVALYTVVVSNPAGSVESGNAAVRVNGLPVIGIQPQSVTANFGQTIELTVVASGGSLTYQWLKNGIALTDAGDVSGSATAELTLTGVSVADDGDYTVWITNINGGVTSQPASVSVVDPAVVTQPQSQTAAAGSTVFFSVATVGTTPIVYQWQKDGMNLTDAGNVTGSASATLTLAGVTDSDAGSYSVIVSNAVGLNSRSNTTLSINDTADLGSWNFNTTNWMGDQGQLPLVASNVADVASWTGAGGALLVDTNNAALIAYRTVETNGSCNINLQNGSISFWYKADTTPHANGRLIEVGAFGPTNDWWSLLIDGSGGAIDFCTATNGTVTTNLTAAINWSTNWHQVVVTYSASSSALYFDGAAAQSNGLGVLCWPGSQVRAQGFAVGSDFATGLQQMGGEMDELQTYNYPLSANQVATNYANEIALNDPNNPRTGGAGPPPTPGGGGGSGMQQNPSGPLGGGLTMNPTFGGGMGANGSLSDASTNSASGFWLTAPVITNSLISLSIYGQDPAMPFDIYARSNLNPGTAWVLATNGAIGQTNYILPVSQYPANQFFIAASGADLNLDGISDGAAALIWHVNPFVNSSGDGLSDAWKLAHGLNPAINYLSYYQTNPPPTSAISIITPTNNSVIQ
jgi:probable HAF family extracellular repeat protein